MNLLNTLINKQVDKRVNELISSTGGLINFVDVDDSNAERMVRNFILHQKEENIKELTTYDFVVNLRLPAPQIDNVMKKFKQAKLVREI